MKTIIPFIVVIFLCFNSIAQTNFEWPIKELDTARDQSYLSDNEKEIILEMNMLRYNPAMYAKIHMKWMEIYYEENFLKIPGKTIIKTEEGKTAFLECIQELEQTGSLPILKPSKGMTKACELLVYDQSLTGKTGHKGSGNSTPFSRVELFGTYQGYFAENIHYGDIEPRFIIIALLIDDGVKSRGHRETLLSKEFNLTGVATGKHKSYKNMCVINYATNFIDK